MKNWDNAEEEPTQNVRCSYTVDREDLLQIVKRLDIPLVEVDFVKEYWHKVFTPFLEDYQSGTTPAHTVAVCIDILTYY